MKKEKNHLAAILGLGAVLGTPAELNIDEKPQHHETHVEKAREIVLPLSPVKEREVVYERTRDYQNEILGLLRDRYPDQNITITKLERNDDLVSGLAEINDDEYSFTYDTEKNVFFVDKFELHTAEPEKKIENVESTPEEASSFLTMDKIGAQYDPAHVYKIDKEYIESIVTGAPADIGELWHTIVERVGTHFVQDTNVLKIQGANGDTIVFALLKGHKVLPAFMVNRKYDDGDKRLVFEFDFADDEAPAKLNIRYIRSDNDDTSMPDTFSIINTGVGANPISYENPVNNPHYGDAIRVLNQAIDEIIPK